MSLSRVQRVDDGRQNEVAKKKTKKSSEKPIGIGFYVHGTTTKKSSPSRYPLWVAM